MTEARRARRRPKARPLEAVPQLRHELDAAIARHAHYRTCGLCGAELPPQPDPTPPAVRPH